jgi:Zn-finger protein
MSKIENSSSGQKVNENCEAQGEHKWMWVKAEFGSQVWACTQCGATHIEWEDSQP